MCLKNYKIIALSDLHGQLPEIKESFDLMLLAGDLVELYSQSSKAATKEWFEICFSDWINSLPFNNEDSKVLWIAGNHEVGFEKLRSSGRRILANLVNERTNGRAIYLEDELYNFHGITVYGTPWCKIFGNWAFMKSYDDLKETYLNIPKNVDILLTHDAPYGTSDLCFDWAKWNRNLIHIGNEPLRDAIIEKSPTYNIHGHLHSANHEEEVLENTKVYCVSLLNEEYNISYSPLILNINKENGN